MFRMSEPSFGHVPTLRSRPVGALQLHKARLQTGVQSALKVLDPQLIPLTAARTQVLIRTS